VHVHQNVMRSAVFPLADLPKVRVRELAAEMQVRQLAL